MHALLHLVPLTLQQDTADPGGEIPLTPPLETPGHSEASLSQSFVGSLFLAPGSWCTQGFDCAKSLFPQSSVKFCNQIPQDSKVKFSRGSQSLCQILRLGNLLWVLELWPCGKLKKIPHLYEKTERFVIDANKVCVCVHV